MPHSSYYHASRYIIPNNSDRCENLAACFKTLVICFAKIYNTGIVRSFSCSLRSRRFRVPRRRFSCHEALPRRKAQRLNRMWRCKASSHNTIKARRAAKPTGKAECFVVARQRLRTASRLNVILYFGKLLTWSIVSL